MRRKLLMTGVAGLIAAMLGGCVADDAAPDQAESKPLGATPEQKGNVTCAVGSTPNSTTTVDHDDGERYARTATEIDTTCDCAAWQQDYYTNGASEAGSDHPLCRAWTWLDATVIGMGDNGVVFGAEVDNWESTSKTECENSELDIAIEEQVAGTWYGSWPTEAGHYYIFHPSFDPTLGSCERFIEQWQPDDIGVYRIKTRAIRGIDADTHGYAGLYTFADPLNNPSKHL